MYVCGVCLLVCVCQLSLSKHPSSFWPITRCALSASCRCLSCVRNLHLLCIPRAKNNAGSSWTGCLENRRPRRIRQQQKQLQWLSAAGAGCLFVVLPNRLTALHNANSLDSSRESRLISSLAGCSLAAWHLGQTLLSISRAIKALNLFGLRCEASDKQAIRREITLYISLSSFSPSLSFFLQ